MVLDLWLWLRISFIDVWCKARPNKMRNYTLRIRGLHNARYYNCAFGICICVQGFYASVYIMDGTLTALKYDSNPRYLQTGLTKRLGAGDEEQRAPSAQSILSNVRTYFDWIETTWQRRFYKTLQLPVSVFPSRRSRWSNWRWSSFWFLWKDWYFSRSSSPFSTK